MLYSAGSSIAYWPNAVKGIVVADDLFKFTDINWWRCRSR